MTVAEVCPYTAPCPGCGRDIPWMSTMRRVTLPISHVPQDVTEAKPGICAHCDTADVRGDLNRSLNREVTPA